MAAERSAGVQDNRRKVRVSGKFGSDGRNGLVRHSEPEQVAIQPCLYQRANLCANLMRKLRGATQRARRTTRNDLADGVAVLMQKHGETAGQSSGADE